MELTNSSGIFMIIHHDGGYSLLFGKKILQSFEICCEQFLLL